MPLKPETRKYFKQVNSTCRVFLFKTQKVFIDQIGPEEAFDLWSEGFDRLALTPQGAKKHFGKPNADDLCMIILQRAKSKEDVFALGSLSKAKKVTETVARRLDELQ